MSSFFKQEPSRYIGGLVKLSKASNGAIVNAENIESYPKSMYKKPTIEKIADEIRQRR